MQGLHCFFKKKRCSLVSLKAWMEEKMVRFVYREATPLCVLRGNLLKRSTDGWEGNLNVIS